MSAVNLYAIYGCTKLALVVNTLVSLIFFLAIRCYCYPDYSSGTFCNGTICEEEGGACFSMTEVREANKVNYYFFEICQRHFLTLHVICKT